MGTMGLIGEGTSEGGVEYGLVAIDDHGTSTGAYSGALHNMG